MDIKGQILARSYVVLVLLCVFPLLVAMRVMHITFEQGPELRQRGVDQASSHQEIPAVRGTILDRAGRVLAVNTARYDLALDPKVPGFTSAAERSFFDKLSKLTGRPASEYKRKVRDRTSPHYVLLYRGLNEAQKEEVDGWDVPGVVLHPEFARRYNYGQTAAHVLGHLSSADGKGLAGIELQYDAFLRGEPGRRAVKKDRLGRIKAFVGGQVVEPKHGGSVVLTIDLIRQTILEEELARGVAETGALWGTAVAMDPHTGAILAMANVPTYNPNRPGASRVAAQKNHAVSSRIEPGSTFKMVTAVAAVDRGVVKPGDWIDTGDGTLEFEKRTIKDSHPLGNATFEEIVAQSSNVGMHKIALRLENKVLYEYARDLGFGQPTWVDLPGEAGGLLKRPARWSKTTKSALSRGYEVMATPLQVLTAYCALANGGLVVKPHIVAERRDVTGQTVWTASTDSVRRAFKPETARKLRPAFEKTVQEGSAKLATIEGLPIAGKTGTAQKVVGRSYTSAHRASFAGFFPADDPQVAIVIILDEPKTATYGGTASAPIFQRVATRWIGTFPKIADRLAPAQPLPRSGAARVPDVTGQPAAVAAARLMAAGIEVEPARAQERIVRAQTPRAGTTAAGAVVRLTSAAAPDTLLMPDLNGLSARQAAYWLSSRGIPYTIEGQGTVVGQSPEAGAKVSRRAVVRCR